MVLLTDRELARMNAISEVFTLWDHTPSAGEGDLMSQMG